MKRVKPKYRIKRDCFCEHYLHEISYYYRKGIKEKKLYKGDIVELEKEWSNLYGCYYRVIKDNIKYDISLENLDI